MSTSNVSRLAVVLVAALTLCLTGCKNDSESALSEALDYQKDMVKILKGVTDKASAEAAKSKIDELGKKAAEASKKYDKKNMNDAEMTKAMEKYKPEMEQIQKDLMAEVMRIGQNPELATSLGHGGMGGGFGPNMFK